MWSDSNVKGFVYAALQGENENAVKRLTRYKIMAFWERHKFAHRCVLLFVAVPVSIAWALPIAVAAGCGEIAGKLSWVADCWKRSDKPWEKWARELQAEEDERKADLARIQEDDTEDLGHE